MIIVKTDEPVFIHQRVHRAFPGLFRIVFSRKPAAKSREVADNIFNSYSGGPLRQYTWQCFICRSDPKHNDSVPRLGYAIVFSLDHIIRGFNITKRILSAWDGKRVYPVTSFVAPTTAFHKRGGGPLQGVRS